MLYWDTRKEGMVINEGEEGLERVDFLINEARKRNLRLIIAFLDFWPYTGGAQQMRAWYGSRDVYTFFAEDPRTRRDYKQWVENVVLRINSRTGIRYRDDATIFAWELMNEPDIHPAALLKAWVKEMSLHVKKLDPNHLLSTGHANIYDRFADIELETIDFGSWHGYPVHMRIPPVRINEMIGEFCALGKKYEKPMLLSEFGWARSNATQVAVYGKWLETIYANADCAGWLVWRLVSRQDHGKFPEDAHDQFDIRNDGGPLWQVMSTAAQRLKSRAGGG